LEQRRPLAQLVGERREVLEEALLARNQSQPKARHGSLPPRIGACYPMRRVRPRRARRSAAAEVASRRPALIAIRLVSYMFASRRSPPAAPPPRRTPRGLRFHAAGAGFCRRSR